MAKQPRKASTNKAASNAGRVKSSIYFEAEVHKALQLASIDMGIDMSEIVNGLVKREFGSWHIRRGRAAEQGGSLAQGGEPGFSSEGSNVVRISGITNRIDDISRRAHAPVDAALGELAGE